MFATAPDSAALRANLDSCPLCQLSELRKELAVINVLLGIGIILVILWVLGLVTSYTLGGFIYVALVIGLVLVVVSLVPRIRRRR
jgi:hypothetical protein